MNEILKERKRIQDAKKNIILNIPLNTNVCSDVFEFVIDKDGIIEKSKFVLIFKIYRKDRIELTFRRDNYKDPVFTHEDYKNRLKEMVY